jgi:hypothetical protein
MPIDAVAQATEAIYVLRHEVFVMGANDSEIPELDGILKGLDRGDYSPEDAMTKAHGIISRKMDYH